MARAVSITAIAVAIGGALAPGAQAATYSVKQCHQATGGHLSSNWTTWAWGNWSVLNQCPAGLLLAGNNQNGVWAGWELPMPAGLTIDQVTFWSAGYDAGVIAGYAFLCTSPGAPTCGWTDIENTLGPASQHTLSAPGANRFQFSIQKLGGLGTTTGWSSIWNMEFTLNDRSGPSASTSGGSLISSTAGWNRGVQSGGLNGGDVGSGVKSVTAIFDGNPASAVAVSQQVGCDYNNIQPCPANFNWNPAFNTTSLPDGTHTVQYSVADAGGNSTTTAPMTFKVDNTDPALPTEPTIPVSGQNGWHRNNDFDLAWENSGEAAATETESGLKTVWYDVEPTNLAQGDPAPVPVPVFGATGAVAATDETLANVSVPEGGTWKLNLWTEDHAGNESVKREANLKFDATVPDKANGVANGWISRQELIGGVTQKWFPPTNVNNIVSEICGYAFEIDQSVSTDPGIAINRAGPLTQASIPANTPEGDNFAHFRAISCSHVAASIIEHVPLPVDLTDPEIKVVGVPDVRWVNTSASVNLIATDALSGTSPASVDKAFDAGAYVPYSVDDGLEQIIRGGNGNVTLESEGMHSLDVAAVDVAGNRAKTQSVDIGIDKTAPGGTFIGIDSNDPTTFRLPVHDTLSGVAGGQIQYAAGDGLFKGLATRLEGDSLVASFPDTALPRGSYRLQAVVRDHAGNSALISRKNDGSEMRFTNPLRRAANLVFGAQQTIRVCNGRVARTCAKRCKIKRARCKAKRVRGRLRTTIVTATTVAYGRSAMLYGTLTTTGGLPMAYRRVEFYSRRAGEGETLMGAAITDQSGAVAFRAPSGTSRTIRAYYPGDRLDEDIYAEARVNVPTRVQMRLSKHRIKRGQWVRFIGKVFAGDPSVNPAGKLVQLQFKNGRKWQAGPALVRADKNGRFTAKYKWRRVGPQPIRVTFRALVPDEPTWVYSMGNSRPVTVVVYP